jgi:hypothetical protein
VNLHTELNRLEWLSKSLRVVGWWDELVHFRGVLADGETFESRQQRQKRLTFRYHADLVLPVEL